MATYLPETLIFPLIVVSILILQYEHNYGRKHKKLLYNYLIISTVQHSAVNVLNQSSCQSMGHTVLLGAEEIQTTETPYPSQIETYYK